MLKKLFQRYGGDNWEHKFNSFQEQLIFVDDCLRKRKRLTELYTDREIETAIDQTVDSLIEIRQIQRQLEKLLIFINKEKRLAGTEMFLDKEEKRLNFDEVAGSYIAKYRINSTKKTITSEEKKNLFRVFYKQMYSEHSRKESAYDEWLSFVTDERNNILNLRSETTNWQNILKKKLKTN
ncbi:MULTISPECIES: hypothetical protein [Bacteria]|uniref:hypothetical protein n=1 Tax=Bacteria TaxID=2 RepID=UPI003F40B834